MGCRSTLHRFRRAGFGRLRPARQASTRCCWRWPALVRRTSGGEQFQEAAAAPPGRILVARGFRECPTSHATRYASIRQIPTRCMLDLISASFARRTLASTGNCSAAACLILPFMICRCTQHPVCCGPRPMGGLWERKLDTSNVPNVDIYVRDHVMDTARILPTPAPLTATFDDPLQNVTIGSPLWWWMCADIKVDSPAANTHTYQMPVADVDYLGSKRSSRTAIPNVWSRTV